MRNLKIKTKIKHLDNTTFARLYLRVGVIVQSCEWVVIEARAVIILVCGHIWHSCNQKEVKQH